VAASADTWLDCDVRFVAEEARAQEVEKLELEMAQAAQALEFEKAQALKMRLAALKASELPKPPPPETWLLPASEFPAFGRFLTSRGVQPSDVQIGCEPEPNGAAVWGTRTCQECVKLNSGGPYGKVGVVSPAYPPQEKAEGCLGLSSTVDADLSAYDGLGDGTLSDESYDGSELPSSVAFCRAV